MVRAADQVRAERMSLQTAGPSAHVLPLATIRTRTGPTPDLCARSAMRSVIDRQGSRNGLLAAATAAADAQTRRPGCLHSAEACAHPHGPCA